MKKTLSIFLITSMMLFSPLSVGAVCYNYNDEEEKPINDPLEKLNRNIYKFNTFSYKILLRPLAITYNKIVPNYGRQAVTNVLNNLGKPVSFVNNILQGNIKLAAHNFWQFTINSTLGVGGIIDFAQHMPLDNSQTKFSDTLKKYGMKNQGAYLMLPVIGPSTMRNFSGLLLDISLDPLNKVFHRDFFIVKNGVNIINNVENNVNLVDNIINSSLDSYVRVRSMYLENANTNCSD